MSKQQFNNFLVDKLLTWFESNIKIGEKYKFDSDDEQQLNSIMDSLRDKDINKLPFLDVEVPYINIQGTKLIFVNNFDGLLNDNNIATLRDSLSESDDFKNCAMLIIYKYQSGVLDTLDTASKDLSLPGYPFSATIVKSDMQQLISKSSTKKNIFKYLLSSVSIIIEEDDQSAFGYADLYNSIIDDAVDFNKFNLFEDTEIYKLEASPDSIAKRLKENEALFRKIKTTVTDFPNELSTKLTDLSPEFIRKNVTVEKWEDNTYSNIKLDIDNVKNQSISFDDEYTIFDSDDLKRSNTDSKAGKRTQNIVIFSDREDVTLSLKVDGPNLSKSNFVLSNNKTIEKECEPQYNKRQSIASVTFKYDFSPTYFTLVCNGAKSSDKHTFKVLVLRKNSFYFEDIKTNYIINPRKELVLLQLDTFKLRFNAVENTTSTILTDKTKQIDIGTFHTIDFTDYYNKNDDVAFDIKNGLDELHFEVEGSKEENSISIPFLLNPQMLNKLFHNHKDIEFNSTKNKAIIENREFPLNFERLEHIKWEHEFIDNKLFSSTHKELSISILKVIDEPLYEAYTALLNYFTQHKTTPSLCAWNDIACSLAEGVIETYLNYMKNVEEDSTLDEDTKTLFEFGFITKKSRRMMSPFTPLVLAYILYLVKEAKEDKSFQDISNVTLSRLNIKGLFPYLFVNKDQYAFSQVSKHDALWLEFVPKEDSEFSFVKDLSLDKIEEFIDSFQELFTTNAPLIINSVNNHTNKELFEGIVAYYKKNFASKPKKMVINLYDASFTQTEFDVFADMDNYDEIKKRYTLNVDAETIIDTIRTHINYSKHTLDDEQTYCHLSFFKNDEKVVIKDRTIEQTKSGLVSKGLVSGESSQQEKGNYFSGFGLSNVETTGFKHLELAQVYNAMQRPVYETGTNYESKKTIALMISENFKTLLKQSYEKALWTVIIDPKVTLEFFNNAEDLILIHFSDQYSSSANYDAVTVTAQKELYSNVVAHVGSEIDKENIIKQFNAFNGEWLIKMISENEKIKKERVSIISTYKYMAALLTEENTTWVPLSVAEMIRVSGNVGLPMSGSDFSRYNENLTKGAISDDILLVGFRDDKVILYPVEVKSHSGDMEKAKKQAKALRGFFYERLFKEDSFKTRLLKGLFIRQVFMQIEKYELYDTFEPNYFESLHQDRERLLEGRYELAELENHSQGAVVAFLKDRYSGKFDKQEEILEIKLPYEHQNNMLPLSYTDLKEALHKGEFDTNPNFLLSKKVAVEIEKTTTVIKIEKDEPDESEEVVEVIQVETKPTQPLEIKFGENHLTKNDILWHPTNTIENQNTNTGIIGTMGTGKTQFTKSLVTQLVHQSNNNVTSSKIDIIIFDYKGDYIGKEFVKATDATVYELEKLPFNPLALFGGKPKLPTHTGRTLTTTLSKAFSLGNVQKSILKNVIQDAYRENGIVASDKNTWSLPAPTLDDIWELYSQREDTKQDSLYAALDDLIDFEIFESDTSLTKSLYDVIDGVTVINLSGYDSNIQNLVVAIILDLFYVQMHNHGSSVVDGDFRQIAKMILVDEADNFMSQDFDSLKKILKEGREFGVGTILSTQELTHFKTAEDNYANYIFTWIIHKVSNIKTQDIQSVFNINGKSEAENLMSQVRELQKHFSFYVDGNKEISKMRDLAFWELLKEETRDK
ncbi:DNA phosphorothioation-dependent restriction protein DptH [Sulfurimonas sp.]|uniref:DNA phosphorothioation-dependent restriction protein DptH n=1 Tax=Sulfurimonas sp. TaxID=2022749 RepID=UPI0035666D4E